MCLSNDFYRIKKTVNIKIPIIVDRELRNFIFDNINMYRRIKNDFIEVANKHFDKYGTYKGFNALIYKTEYYTMEKEIERYRFYARGLSEQVAKDIDWTINSILAKHEKYGTMGKMHFRRFDRFRGTFKVHLKPTRYKVKLGTKYNSRVDDTPIENIFRFTVRGAYHGDKKQTYSILLKEALCDDMIYDKHNNHTYIRYFKEGGIYGIHECRFTRDDIKTITFIHELDHFYIQLAIDVTYIIDKDMVEGRMEKVGIDTGIRNPIVMYDGNRCIRFAMDDKKVDRINRIHSKVKYYQSIMTRKYRINKRRVLNGEMKTPYSKNYEKVRKKFRKGWKRIVNIKRQWHFDVAKAIVTNYKMIIVDRFTRPIGFDDDIPSSIKKKINSGNVFHCMYTFNERLEHMAKKYGSIYIEAPDNTTRTCSVCLHKNEPLSLKQKYLVCEKCGSTIHRDDNAAKNCYNFMRLL